MIYTSQRKKELNAALLSRLGLPEIEDGDMLHVRLSRIPGNAVEIDVPNTLEKAVPFCTRPWDEVLPVFISGTDGHPLVAFVNCSRDSIDLAIEKMETRKIYYIPGLTIRKGVDYGRV